MFKDRLSRGENVCPNKGNAFTNWKKQQEHITKHEKRVTHLNAKVDQVMFLQGISIASMIHKQNERGAEMRKSEVLANRNLLKRIIDVIMHLGKQRLAQGPQ